MRSLKLHLVAGRERLLDSTRAESGWPCDLEPDQAVGAHRLDEIDHRVDGVAWPLRGLAVDAHMLGPHAEHDVACPRAALAAS